MSPMYLNSYYHRKVLDDLSLRTPVVLHTCNESEDDELSSIQSLEPNYDNESEDGEDMIPNMLLLGTLLQHPGMHKIIKDDTIQFGCRLLIDDFNEGQCLQHFRFRKCHQEYAESI